VGRSLRPLRVQSSFPSSGCRPLANRGRRVAGATGQRQKKGALVRPRPLPSLSSFSVANPRDKISVDSTRTATEASAISSSTLIHRLRRLRSGVVALGPRDTLAATWTATFADGSTLTSVQTRDGAGPWSRPRLTGGSGPVYRWATSLVRARCLPIVRRAHGVRSGRTRRVRSTCRARSPGRRSGADDPDSDDRPARGAS
jgi:hypothetical protein